MNLVQARLQLAIRTAYEEVIMGDKSPGLIMLLEQFNDPNTYSYRQEALARMVHHYNFAPKDSPIGESSMFLGSVIFLLDSAIYGLMDDITAEQQEIAFTKIVEASISFGEAVKGISPEMILFNYSLSELLTTGKSRFNALLSTYPTTDLPTVH